MRISRFPAVHAINARRDNVCRVTMWHVFTMNAHSDREMVELEEKRERGREGEVTGNTEEVPIELIITKIAINNEWNGRDQLLKLSSSIPPTNAHAFPRNASFSLYLPRILKFCISISYLEQRISLILFIQKLPVNKHAFFYLRAANEIAFIIPVPNLTFPEWRIARMTSRVYSVTHLIRG